MTLFVKLKITLILIWIWDSYLHCCYIRKYLNLFFADKCISIYTNLKYYFVSVKKNSKWREYITSFCIILIVQLNIKSNFNQHHLNFSYRQDGIEFHQPETVLGTSSIVLPYAPTFHSFHRHRLLLTRLIPSNLQVLANDTLNSAFKVINIYDRRPIFCSIIKNKIRFILIYSSQVFTNTVLWIFSVIFIICCLLPWTQELEATKIAVTNCLNTVLWELDVP